MTEAPKAYLLDQDGQVDEYEPQDAQGLLGVGYTPAGKSQVEDFLKEKAFHEKYGTFGQQAKTFAEGGAQSLTAGLSTFGERALGVNLEDIKARQEENPGSHLAGSITGAALPLILTAGASALPEGVGAAASLLTAPGRIARAGELTSEGVAGLLGEHATTALGRIAAKAASSGAGSFVEGTAWGLGQVVHESALGDPNLKASHIIEEVGLSALLGGGIGAGIGVLGQLIGEGANSGLGHKLQDWLDNFEGNQNIKTAAGPGKGQAALRSLYNSGLSPGDAAKLGQEAGDMHLADGTRLIEPLDQAATVFEKTQTLKGELGPKMGDLLGEVDNSGARPSSINKIASEFRENVLAPYAENPANRSAVAEFTTYLDGNEARFGTHIGGEADHDLTFAELHKLRHEADDEAFKLNKSAFTNPENSKSGHLYHEFRNALSDEISGGIEKASLPKATAEEWASLNRAYSVASKIGAIAQKGAASRGLSGLSLTALVSGLTGLVHGGPLGAIALGGAATLAKRYGPQALAATARGVRSLVDDGAAEGLASKTAEAISTAREAGVEGVAQAEGTAMARAWQKVSETLGDPVGSPTKDFLRDTSREKLAQQPEGTPVETVAALSHLERASQRVENRVQDGASALLRGAAKVSRGGALAGVASTFAKDSESAHAAFTKRAEKVRSLAAQPDLLQKRLQAATASLDEHAPNTAQAIQVAMARCLNVLNQALGPPSPHAPLEEPPPPAPDAVACLSRVFEVVQEPSNLLKQAAACTLTLEAVAAVKAAHPQAYAHMQQAVLEKLASRRGPVPYAQRQMVSLIMGRDMDGTQSPQAIAEHQAAASIQAPPHAGASNKPTSKGLEKLHLSNRMLTPAQAATARGVEGE